MGATSINVYELFDAIKAIAGQGAVERLRQWKGGYEVEVPTRAIEGNWLTELVTLQDAHLIIKKLSTINADGRTIALRCYVPIGKYSALRQRKAHCRKVIEKGATAAEAAEVSGLTIRTAFRVIANLRAEQKEKSRAAAKKSAASNGVGRVGMLERMLLDGVAETVISRQLQVPLDRIATRRNQLRRAGMLPVAVPDQSLSVATDATPAPSRAPDPACA